MVGVDAKDQTLGRVATQIATLLKGKHKPEFSQHMDMGDFVIVINCERIHVTGRRMDQKVYYRHSQYPGGLKSVRCVSSSPKSQKRSWRAPYAVCCPRIGWDGRCSAS